MIFDTLDRAASYRSLSSRFAAGFDWLAKFDPQTADGRINIDGDDVFALVQSYDTQPAAEKKFEAHRKYADIQYIAAGQETMYYAPLGKLSPSMGFDTEKDYTLFHEPAAGVTTALAFAPGSFAIFLPQDGHKPGCATGTPMKIKKVVIKVRVG